MKEKDAVEKDTDVKQWTETMYLLAGDEMKDKLLDGMKEGLKDCVCEDEVEW